MNLNYFSKINSDIVGLILQISELSNSGYFFKAVKFEDFIKEYLPEAEKPDDVYNALKSELKNQEDYLMSFVEVNKSKMGAMAVDLLKSERLIEVIEESMRLIKEKYIDV